MLQISRNSVICPVVLSATTEQVTTLQTYLNAKGVEVHFNRDFAVCDVIAVRTIKVPKKCLKSFGNLFKWVRERVEKELSNYNTNEGNLLAVYTALGLSGRTPDESDYALYGKWTDKLGFAQNGIVAAAKKQKFTAG